MSCQTFFIHAPLEKTEKFIPNTPQFLAIINNNKGSRLKLYCNKGQYNSIGKVFIFPKIKIYSLSLFDYLYLHLNN